MTNDKREALIADPNAATRALVIPAEDGRVLLAIRSDGTVTGEVEDAGDAGARFVAYLREHVFEQAHTPTDDEREARARILAKLDRIPDSDAVTLDKADVRAAVRRPVPAEPPRHPALIANRTINKAIQNNEVGGWGSTIRVEQAHELIVEALTFDRSERFGRPVQGEPTDAQVEAGCVAFYEHASGLTSWSRLGEYDTVLADRYREGIRRSLRAAAAVQTGENR